MEQDGQRRAHLCLHPIADLLHRVLDHLTGHQPNGFQLAYKIPPPGADGTAGDIAVVPVDEAEFVVDDLSGQLAHILGAGHLLHKGVGVFGAHNQLHPDPMARLTLLQGLVIDADTERGRGSADVGGSAVALLAVEGNHGRPGGHAAVYLVGLGLGENIIHIQVSRPVVTGDVNAGDVGVCV